MLNQSNLIIQTNLDTLTEFRSRQTGNLNHYKKATRKLNRVIKEVKIQLQNYQSLVRRNEKLPRPVELHLGFSWYIDQDEIWRFYIGDTKSELNNLPDEKILELIKKNCEELEETFKKCNKEKIAIREQLKFLEYYLKVNDPSKYTSDDAKFVKISLKDVELIKKKYRIKFFNDLSTWKAEKLLGNDIPKLINDVLDRIFSDKAFLFTEYESFNPDFLETKKEGLFLKIFNNLNDYSLGEYGHIEIKEVEKLIDIQLSVLLKSYKSILPADNKIEKIRGNSTEYGKLITIKKDFLSKYMEPLGLIREKKITLKQRNQIEEILNREYQGVNFESFLVKLRTDGFAKPQKRNR